MQFERSSPESTSSGRKCLFPALQLDSFFGAPPIVYSCLTPSQLCHVGINLISVYCLTHTVTSKSGRTMLLTRVNAVITQLRLNSVHCIHLVCLQYSSQSTDFCLGYWLCMILICTNARTSTENIVCPNPCNGLDRQQRKYFKSNNKLLCCYL